MKMEIWNTLVTCLYILLEKTDLKIQIFVQQMGGRCKSAPEIKYENAISIRERGGVPVDECWLQTPSGRLRKNQHKLHVGVDFPL